MALFGTVNVGVNGDAVVGGISSTIQQPKENDSLNTLKYMMINIIGDINKSTIPTSVFLKLSGKGKIITKDMNIVHLGSQ